MLFLLQLLLLKFETYALTKDNMLTRMVCAQLQIWLEFLKSNPISSEYYQSYYQSMQQQHYCLKME